MLYKICYPDSFDHLDTLRVNNFGGTVFYDGNISKVINKKAVHGKTVGSFTTDVIITKINRHKNIEYLIAFDAGPSDDPSYTILKIDKKDTLSIGSVFGDQKLVIPGNGYIYSIARANQICRTHKKYLIDDYNMEEVKQPFYYVGTESEALEDITLYQDTPFTTPVAKLPKGSQLTVLLMGEKKRLLIKTPFGLTGWYKLKNDYPRSELKGIFFAGD
jgi:hypothetical protein